VDIVGGYDLSKFGSIDFIIHNTIDDNFIAIWYWVYGFKILGIWWIMGQRMSYIPRGLLLAISNI